MASPSKGAPRKATTNDILQETKKAAERERIEKLTWSPLRVTVARWVGSAAFDMSTSVLILFSILFVILDANSSADESPTPQWITTCNMAVLGLYLVELCLRLFAYRLRFFQDISSVVDFVVIFLDVVVTVIVTMWPMSLPVPVALTRIARIMKLSRAVRMMTMFPELNAMVRGIMFASKTILWGMVLLAMLLCLWSIFAVLFIHPIVRELDREGFWAALQCQRCPMAYSSVQMAMLTFCQQLVIGENWAEINIPLMEKRPETAFFFISAMVSTTLAALNLFLGVIVERSAEARAESVQEAAEKKEQNFKEASRRLYQICKDLDGDDSGVLSFDELKAGFETNAEFADILKVMDINECDLEVLFHMLDQDGSGDVEYEEFVEQLHMMKNHDSHTLLVFIKFYIMEIRRELGQLMSAGLGKQQGPAALKRSPSFLFQHLVGEATPPVRSKTTTEESTEHVELAEHDLERELKQLLRLKHEALDFSRLHAICLDELQERLAQCCREKLRLREDSYTEGVRSDCNFAFRNGVQELEEELQKLTVIKQKALCFSEAQVARFDDFRNLLAQRFRSAGPELVRNTGVSRSATEDVADRGRQQPGLATDQHESGRLSRAMGTTVRDQQLLTTGTSRGVNSVLVGRSKLEYEDICCI